METQIAHKPLSETHYNETPKGFTEISHIEFSRIFFLYCFSGQTSKQVHRDSRGRQLKEVFLSILFWEVEYSGWEGMGVAMAFDNDSKMRYFKFGEQKRWEENSSRFAAQFAGDNS